MAGNTRFDLSAAKSDELAFKGSFTNGQRGNLTNGTLDRSTSFREGNEGQMFISGANMSRGNSTSAGDLASVAQCLMLDPITMGDQKYTRSGELRRVLGISFGNILEDCAFGTANLKAPPPVATEELKRFKASVQEASVRARYRSKRLDESLDKLNKCWEAVSLKKQLWNDLVPNERLGGSHFSKMGSQTHRRPSELVNQRPENRPKNVILNKRIRTSVAETRAEGLSNSFARQPLAMGKDRDNIKDGSRGCDIFEEKIRRLPGGETWDRKMKRKRSVGTVVARSIDGEGELKKVMHIRLANESGPQGSDAQGLRSGYSGSNSKLDGASVPATFTTANNEQEKVSRGSVDGSNKERVVLKGNKFNVRNNNYTGGIHTLTKGKASRPPRTGALMAGNSSSVPCSSEILDAEEQPSNVNKPHSVSGTINRKRPLPVGSSSSPMAQWVGQRPQKISRTRRANVVSPVPSSDEVHTSLEGCSPSDVITRKTTAATSGFLISNGAINGGIHPGKMKHESVSSPTKLSESEESGAGENGESKMEKGLESNEVDGSAINNSYNTSSSMLTSKKKKIPNKEEVGDGLRRQGRGSRGSSVLKNGISPMKEKLETPTLMKPIKNMKPASEKNGSKSGRPPLKKSCDRKSITRIGHPSTNNSPDIADIGCSSSFWKKLEPIFSPVSLKDMSYLKQLVKTTEADLRCLSQMLGIGSDALDRLTHTESPLSQSSISRARERSIVNQTDSKEISSMDDMVGQHLDVSILCQQMDSEGNKLVPLYQRVLTALIIDEEIVEDGNMPSLCERDDSPQVACHFQDVENQSSIRMDFEFNSDKVSCNGNATFTSCTDIHDQELGIFLQMNQGSLHLETERVSMLSENGNDESMGMHGVSCSASFSCHFEQMSMEDKLLLELQSVGLYPEPVPDLADGDCEAINQDIIQLQKGLFQQVNKKRECFMKLIQAVEQGREMEQGALEQVAMDKLVELAHKKKLATRGTSAARYGLSKVSRPVALAFMKRTLARCRKFEGTGKSCFLEPLFKDVLFAAPAPDNTGSAVAANLSLTRNSQQESAPSGYFPCREQDVLGNLDHPSDQDFAMTGPILNRGKKKELLLDDVGASPLLRSASIPGSSLIGGAKGKRSEQARDNSSGRNSVSKGGRSSAKGERKTKAKSKPKTAQLSSSGNGSLSKLMENTNSENQLACGSNEFVSSDGSRKSKVGSVSHNYNTNDLSIGTEEPMDITLDSIELGVGDELDGPQDLDSWLLTIEDDGLQGDAIGLDIPMDDLSGLNMLL
ncbi:hypothetical protein GLYMA_20G110300v4 [Glycine max]|uniref:Uncharacterized protein n=1 Tax=Glycine max TaxID=3847 RepID=A0A368UG94_SOYBN|nr:hypothetical protein GLYMA_20G110300v4 [Glycine max]